MMNILNASTSVVPFQLQLGCCPQVIPPVVSDMLDHETATSDEGKRAMAVMDDLDHLTAEVKDALIKTEMDQSWQANKH